MHPAPSLIIFTTLSGLGFGLIFWIGVGFGPDDLLYGWLACLLAGGLATVGLLASTLHLGNPQRAWRALSQWRSSWLSREGCLAVSAMALFGLYTGAWLFFGVRALWLGALAGLLSLATVYATAMIYAQLKTVPRWCSGLTPVLFLSLSISGGYLVVVTLIDLTGELSVPLSLGALVFLGCTSAIYVLWRHRAISTGLDAAGSTPETATGLGFMGRVRLLEPPHSAPNYLMREMVFQVARKHAEKVLLLGAFFAVLVPTCALFLAVILGISWFFMLLASLSHIAGVLALRWLFFAEAEHVVGLYYGQR